MNIVLIFASGKGTRMGAAIPKQFLEIDGKPILVHTAELFQYHSSIDKIYVVTLAEYIPYVEKLKTLYHLDKVRGITEGGDSAQESIYRGLKMIEKENSGDSVVLLHDGVRPFVSADVITRNIEGVHKNGNAITSVPAFETILTSKDGKSIQEVPIRKETYIGQAPQSFYLKDIIEAHEIIRNRPEGYENMVEGNRGNIKVTTPEDVYTLKAYLQYKENEQTFGLGETNKIGAQYQLMKNDDNRK